MHEQFLRTEMVLGPRAMERLAAAHVAVLGLGGVGSWAAEALARAGVGELTLADHDEVGVTNINRQIEALWSTLAVPRPKPWPSAYWTSIQTVGFIRLSSAMTRAPVRNSLPRATTTSWMPSIPSPASWI